MRILVYTAKRWVVSTRRLFRGLQKLMPKLEVDLVTSPPLTGATFDYCLLEQADIVYLRLHGIAEQPYLYGQGHRGAWLTALSLECFKRSKLSLPGNLIFFEGCFAGQTGIPDALLAAGAREIVVSDGETFNRRIRVGPAGKVGEVALLAWMTKRNVEEAVKREIEVQSKYPMRFRVMRR